MKRGKNSEAKPFTRGSPPPVKWSKQLETTQGL